MKKSKVLIPAMALLLFSTAASITGTVAWFQASKTATFTVGNFAVVKTSENLTYDLTAGAATTIGNDGTANESVQFSNADALTHASYNHKNNNIMKAAEDGNSITAMYPVTGTGSPTAANLEVTNLGTGAGKVYCAATWKIDFKLTFGANEKIIGLFVDWSKTYFAKAVTFEHNDGAAEGKHKISSDEVGTYYKDVALTEANKITPAANDEIDAGTYYVAPQHTGKGFRIALHPTGATASDTDAAAKARVMAKCQTSANSKCKYVSGSDTTACTTNMTTGTDYLAADHDLLASDTSTLLVADDGTEVTTAQGYNGYLGLFPFAASQEVTLSFMAIAWYEGTDENIVNQISEDRYETMAAELAFKTATLAATSTNP